MGSHEKVVPKSSWSEASQVEGDLPGIGGNTLAGITMKSMDLHFQQSRDLRGQTHATYMILFFHLNWREYREGEGDWREYKKITTGQELMALSMEIDTSAINVSFKVKLDKLTAT